MLVMLVLEGILVTSRKRKLSAESSQVQCPEVLQKYCRHVCEGLQRVGDVCV
jgi:hypothetical protein